MTAEELSCARCGRRFARGRRGPRATYCSVNCRTAAAQRRRSIELRSRPRSCAVCSSPLTVGPRGPLPIVCSRECAQRRERNRRAVEVSRG